MKNGHPDYSRIDILTADPMKLVLMLYDGAIHSVNRAVECTLSGQIKDKNFHVNRARDIILELNNALKTDIGGEIAVNLRALYLFMNRHLQTANWRNDVHGMQEVRELLTDLRETWRQVYDRQQVGQPQARIPSVSGIRI